jgi:hypothetical protein
MRTVALLVKSTNHLIRKIRFARSYLWKDRRPTLIYYRSAKTGSNSIIDSIKSSFESHIEIKNEKDLAKLANHHKIIIVSVASKPFHDRYIRIQEALNRIDNKRSFAVVRNPYTKVISSYKYLKYEKSIEQLLVDLPSEEPGFSHFSRSQTEALFLKGRQIPEHIIKFEELNNKIDEYFRAHGFKIPKLRTLNSSGNIKINLSERAIGLVNEIYNDDFMNFGYKKIIV